MPASKSLVRQLAKYAIGKDGAEQASNWSLHDVLDYPHVALPGLGWGGHFFEVDEDTGVAEMPVLKGRLKQLRKLYPTIRKTDWMERDGHIQMAVPLDAGIPIDFLKSLIDEAHAIVWNKLDGDERLRIAISKLPYNESKLIDRLVEIHHLEDKRSAIRKLARPAILLRTTKSSEAKIPLGASKIGGRPDLPRDTVWPTYHDSKPLAFLGQIDLAQIARLGTPIKGLPREGLLSVFSVWGWLSEDNLDPQTPSDGTDLNREQQTWTSILHTPRRKKLERRKVPREVNAFKAAAIDPTPILSLPNHRQEPALSALAWSEEDYLRFERMQSDYRSLQMSHWLNQRNSLASHHLLGGYALFQQQYPAEILDQGLTMLLQIGSDGNSMMCWGDGGELTFYADARALAKGRFEHIWGTCQCG